MKILVASLLLIAALAGCGDAPCESCFVSGAADPHPLALPKCDTKEMIFESNCTRTGGTFQGCSEDYYQDEQGQFHAECTCSGSTQRSFPCEPTFI